MSNDKEERERLLLLAKAKRKRDMEAARQNTDPSGSVFEKELRDSESTPEAKAKLGITGEAVKQAIDGPALKGYQKITGTSDEELAEQLGSSYYGAVAGLPAQAISAAEAAAQAIEKGSLEDLGEDFANNRDEYIEAYEEAEKLHPGITIGSDVVSAVAGPGKIKLGYQAALGAASAAARVRSDDPWEMAQQAALGGAFTLGFGYLGEKASDAIAAKQVRLGKQLGAIADETTKDLIDHGTKRKELNEFINKVFNADGSKTKIEAADEFVKYTDRYSLGKTKLFDPGDTIDDTAFKASHIVKQVGEKKSKLLKKYDRPLSKSEILSLYDEQKRRLIDIYSDSKLGMPEDTLKKVLKRLDEDFYRVSEEVVEELAEVPLTNKAGELIYDANNNVIKTKKPVSRKKYTKELKDLNVSTIEKRKRELDNIFYNRKSTNQDISDIHYFEVTGNSSREFLEDAIPEMREVNKEYRVIKKIAEISGEIGNKSKGGVVSKTKQILNLRTVFLASAAAGSGMGDVPKVAVLAVAKKMIDFANDPSATAGTAKVLRKIGENLQKDPGSPMIRRLAAYSHLPFNDFRNKLAGVAAEYVLGEKAVARTSDEAITRSDDILAAARGVDESLATQLKEILESGNEDSIGAFMDGLSKDPKLSKFFEPGIGFNGKVYDPQDKAMLEEQLRANDDIPYAQKLQLIDDLNKNGTIPQPQEQAPDFMEFITRNKDKPEY